MLLPLGDGAVKEGLEEDTCKKDSQKKSYALLVGVGGIITGDLGEILLALFSRTFFNEKI